MTSSPLQGIFQRLLTFALVCALRWLAEIWQLSRWGATGELEGEFKFQRQSCKLSFLFPPCRQSASESLLTGYVSYGYVVVQFWFNFIFLCFGMLVMYDKGFETKENKIDLVPFWRRLIWACAASWRSVTAALIVWCIVLLFLFCLGIAFELKQWERWRPGRHE